MNRWREVNFHMHYGIEGEYYGIWGDCKSWVWLECRMREGVFVMGY